MIILKTHYDHIIEFFSFKKQKKNSFYFSDLRIMQIILYSSFEIMNGKKKFFFFQFFSFFSIFLHFFKFFSFFFSFSTSFYIFLHFFHFFLHFSIFHCRSILFAVIFFHFNSFFAFFHQMQKKRIYNWVKYGAK